MAVENQDVFDSLVRSRIQMLMTFPFFGILALNLQLIEDKKIPTAGTDGKVFLYNPEYIKKLSEAERNFIVVHEVLHPALKHLWRRKDRQPLPWNCACDYAINSIIMEYAQLNNQTQNIKMPANGLIDKKYDGMSAEEIYDTFEKITMAKMGKGEGDGSGHNVLDDHSVWEDATGGAEGEVEAADWEGKLVAAYESAESKQCGKMPSGLKRILDKITKPQKDWRTLLNEFIIEYVNDYSFNPPDRRFDGSPFFMPDFNEPESEVKDIVFWIDTSGSIGAEELAKVTSEIVGAIQQMNGNLQGYVGYFDAKAYELNPFESVSDVLSAPLKGGGGTDFHEPFHEVKRQLTEKDHEVAGIIMLTDGYAPFPPESIADGVPTLWLITNEIQKPTFGLHTTIKV